MSLSGVNLSCSWGGAVQDIINSQWGFCGLSVQQVLGIDSGSPGECDAAPVT